MAELSRYATSTWWAAGNTAWVLWLRCRERILLLIALLWTWMSCVKATLKGICFRLARNLLRDVIGRYAGNEPDSVFALEEIQKAAALMRFELERGNVDGFAKLLEHHWELSKKVDAGSSNTLIEQIFSSIEELIDGRLVCGAGGGGFLQVVLKKGVTKKQVADRLHEVFMDSLVDVADCKLLW